MNAKKASKYAVCKNVYTIFKKLIAVENLLFKRIETAIRNENKLEKKRTLNKSVQKPWVIVSPVKYLKSTANDISIIQNWNVSVLQKKHEFNVKALEGFTYLMNPFTVSTEDMFEKVALLYRTLSSGYSIVFFPTSYLWIHTVLFRILEFDTVLSSVKYYNLHCAPSTLAATLKFIGSKI